jgi:hypothetical protein
MGQRTPALCTHFTVIHTTYQLLFLPLAVHGYLILTDTKCAGDHQQVVRC